MLMPGGKKKKAAGQKRPRPAALALSTSPHHRHQQQQQGTLPTATSSNQQSPQQQHNKKKKAKKEDKDAGMGLGAWIMLSGTERDIFVDRCQKEIAPLLGVLPAAGEEEDDDDEAKPMDESDGKPSTSNPSDRKNQQKHKRQKPRVKVFSAKEGTSAHKYARKCLCIGINEVTRALEKGQLSLLFICRDVKPPRLVEHIAVLAALRGVPFFVLPKATASLGQALGLQRVAALGFRTKQCAAAAAQRGGGNKGEAMENENEEVVVQVQTRLQSFQAFLLAKREYVNGEESGSAGDGGSGAEEGGDVNISM